MILKNPNYVKEAKDLGLVVIPYVDHDIEDENDIKEIKQLGIDGVIYDRYFIFYYSVWMKRDSWKILNSNFVLFVFLFLTEFQNWKNIKLMCSRWKIKLKWIWWRTFDLYASHQAISYLMGKNLVEVTTSRPKLIRKVHAECSGMRLFLLAS